MCVLNIASDTFAEGSAEAGSRWHNTDALLGDVLPCCPRVRLKTSDLPNRRFVSSGHF